MPEIHVYEPPVRGSTGVCGPDLDQQLVTVTADAAHTNGRGGRVVRHNLASDAQAFVTDKTVRTFMHLAGSEGLPLTTVDGLTVLTGAYPSREQLRRFAALTVPTVEDADTADRLETGTAPPAPSLTLIGGTGSASTPGSGDGCCS